MTIGLQPSSDLRFAFEASDVDNSETISHVELHTILRALGTVITLEQCTEVISKIDAAYRASPQPRIFVTHNAWYWGVVRARVS